MDYIHQFFNTYSIDAYILTICAFIFLIRLIIGIRRTTIIYSKQKQVFTDEPHKISIIITANNKADYLRENLEYFLKQDFPYYEVIVVDECSEDDTQDVLQLFQQKYSHLKVTRIHPDTKFRNTKKLAINIGILAAQYDIVLFSESNCQPANEKWVETFSSYFDKDTAIVMGYANYKQRNKVIDIRRFYRFIRYLQMYLLTKDRKYVLAEGMNIAYRKKLYLESKVFSKNAHSYVGYDTYIVESLSKAGKVKIIKDRKANIIINDERKKMWREDYAYYYFNKKRWSSWVWMRAEIDNILRFVLYLLSLFIICRQNLHFYGFVCILLTFLIDLILINLYLGHLKQKKLFLTSFIVNSVGLIYRGYFKLYSIFTSKKWR